MELTEEDKRLLLCAFEVNDIGNSMFHCVDCIIKDKCSSPDDRNGFNLMGLELIKKLKII